jgi:hypothetical protein
MKNLTPEEILNVNGGNTWGVDLPLSIVYVLVAATCINTIHTLIKGMFLIYGIYRKIHLRHQLNSSSFEFRAIPNSSTDN